MTELIQRTEASEARSEHATPVPPSTEGGAGVSSSVGPASRIQWRKVLWAFSPLAVIGVLIALEFPLCPSRGLLGIPCPGCGLTRATEALVAGDLASMLRFHPLAPILTPVVLFSVFRATAVSAGLIQPTKIDPLGKLPSWFWVSFAVVLVGLWGGRALGFFGGLPDPIDPTRGLFYRGGHAAYELFAALF